MQPDPDVINKWSGSAPFWEKHRDVIAHMFAPVTSALVEDGAIAKGQAVLDVATGPGEPALSIAALVGAKGKVVGIDPIPGMVTAARRAADRLGFGNARFDAAYADHLPFPDAAFDVVISRFGVMFFPSPVDAVREMLRVLKPGGKLALAVWCGVETNPFFSALQRVIARYIDSPPVEPDAPDAFRFAQPGKLRDILGAAGATAPTERLLSFTIEAPIPVEEFWTVRCEMSDKLRDKIHALPPELLGEVKRESLLSLSEYATDQGIAFPAQVRIVSGTNPIRS